MFGLFEPDVCPIGIDIGTHSVRLLQFRCRNDQLILQAASRVELETVPRAGSAEKQFAEAIRMGLEMASFKGRRCVLALPPTAVPTKSVRLPQMPDSDLAQAVQWEAKDRFSFDVSQGRLVYFKSGEVRRGTEVKDEWLLFAASGESLQSTLESATSQKLMVEAIDLAPCAFLRSAQRVAPPRRDGTSALLDVGFSGAQFLIAHDDQILFYKHIDVGGRAITQAIAEKLGVPVSDAAQIRLRLELGEHVDGEESAVALNQAVHEAMRPKLEELARELDMCMRYYVVTFRGARPELIQLAGRQANCSRLQESLTTSLGMRVEPTQSLRGVSELGDAARPDRSSEWAVAAGLSLYPLRAAKATKEGVAA